MYVSFILQWKRSLIHLLVKDAIIINGLFLYEDERDHIFKEKDLCVIIDMELTYEEHIATKVKKAKAIMGYNGTYSKIL